jgi:hypothetical protein
MRSLAVVGAVFFIACGGSVDPGPGGTGATNDPAAPAPPPSDGAGSSPDTPVVTQPTPTPSYPAPRKIGDPPGARGAPFHLVVSNLSPPAGTMRIDFSIDGAPVVTGGFVPNETYTFDFALGDGPHTLEANAASSNRSMASKESFAFETSGERWGIVDAKTVRCDPCSSAILTWRLSESAPVR